jgi:hypothetical protein
MLGTERPQGFGLEIGALDAPLLGKGDHDLLYVDYISTEVISG